MTRLEIQYDTERDLLIIRTPQLQTAYPRTTPTAMCPPNPSVSRSIKHSINRPSAAEPTPVLLGSSEVELSSGSVCPPTTFAPATSTRHPDQRPQDTSDDEQHRYHVADADAADSSIVEARCPDSCWIESASPAQQASDSDPCHRPTAGSPCAACPDQHRRGHNNPSPPPCA